MRQLSIVDQLICEFDTALRTLMIPKHRYSSRATPGHNLPNTSMNQQEKAHVAGLMRINHAGEVCAQALYQGQALTAQLTSVKDQMTQAAAEEVEHLAWCEQRLDELGYQPSVLNPLWYGGALMLGALAGLAGDQWSLGFVAETERQVTLHLQKHLQALPANDKKTKAILAQMKQDEQQHAKIAMAAGAAELPWFIKQLMQKTSKLMTWSAYYL